MQIHGSQHLEMTTYWIVVTAKASHLANTLNEYGAGIQYK